MEAQSYIPGQMIIEKFKKKEDLEDNWNYIYAVVKGKVKIILSDKKYITTIKEDHTFCDYNLFTNHPHKFSAMSADYTDIYRIS